MCKHRYAEYCGLEEPCDDIVRVLDKFSQRIGALRKGLSHVCGMVMNLRIVPLLLLLGRLLFVATLGGNVCTVLSIH